MAERLRLAAHDAEDLAVISACLQDSLTAVGDMAYLPSQRRFAAIFKRFMWEQVPEDPEPGTIYYRVRAGLHFETVLRVQSQGLAQNDHTGLLPLLAATASQADDHVIVELTFAGGGVVRIEAEVLEAHLRDLGNPWPTPNLPVHQTDGGDG